MSVSYWLFQYSVIGDSGCVMSVSYDTLSDSDWRMKESIDTLSTVLLVIQGPVMSVSYWLFQYSVIGDSRVTVLSVSYWLFQYSVIGDSGSLSEMCHIDSFSTVLLVIPGPVMSEWYWLFQYSVIGDSRSCHECVNWHTHDRTRNHQ